MARLAVIVPLTIGPILKLLYTAFNSMRHALLIFANRATMLIKSH